MSTSSYQSCNYGQFATKGGSKLSLFGRYRCFSTRLQKAGPCVIRLPSARDHRANVAWVGFYQGLNCLQLCCKFEINAWTFCAGENSYRLINSLFFREQSQALETYTNFVYVYRLSASDIRLKLMCVIFRIFVYFLFFYARNTYSKGFR